MRHVTSLVCLMILTSAAGVMSEETAEIDAAGFIGIRVEAEVDATDPLWVRCTIEWLRASEDARVSILGPATVAAAAIPQSHDDGTESWSSAPLQVAAGESHELLLALSPTAIGRSVVVIAERADGDVVLQAAVNLSFDGASTLASPQGNVRVIHERLDDGRGVITADHLGPKIATKATINVSDINDYQIPDGPTDCSAPSQIWNPTLSLGVNSAPPGAVTTGLTLHLTVQHPVMADLQIALSKEFATTAHYAWKNGSGVNLDQSFTRDVFNQLFPGIGQDPNGAWVLALRDCFAVDTGYLDYWSLQIEYTAATTIDLVADSLSVDPTSVAPGDSVEVEWAGHVAGTGTVGAAFDIGFYLSNDTTITTSDVLLHQFSVPAGLTAGDLLGSSSPGISMTIPNGTTEDSYYLGVVVDSADVVNEVNETNNVESSQITVSLPMLSIDLVADSVYTGASSVEAGNNIQVSYSGHATGVGTISGSFSLGFYLSSDATVTAGDQLLAQRVGTWATTGGDTFIGTNYTVPVPVSTAPGTYYLGFWADDTGAVAESNETNNTALHHPLTVTGGGGGGGGGGGQANLTAMPCSVTPINAQAGGHATLNWRAINTGDADTGQFRWGIYLSTDSTTTPGSDTLLERQDEPSWPMGHDSGNKQTDVTLTSGLADGLYYIGLALDDLSALAESNESDNICSTQIQVGSSTGGLAPVTRWLVPAAASAPGFGTSNWKTQISVVNPLNENRTASLYFVADGAPWPGVLMSGPITIPPTDRVYVDDVLATLNPAAGLLYVVLDQAGPVVTSRTYNLEPGGATFGQGIPAIPFEGVAPPEVMVLPMVHTDPGNFHTNLGIVHASAGNLQVQVQVFNAAGAMIGTKNYSHAAAWRQVNDLFDDMGLGNQVMYGGWLRVTRTAGAGYWTCYASVVDDRTNDPTYVSPVEVVDP